jgi:curli biogenesis system outer membrane secretion channel CsgG
MKTTAIKSIFSVLTLFTVGAAHAADTVSAVNEKICEQPTKSVMIGKVTCSAALCKVANNPPSGGASALIQLAQASGGMPNVAGLSDDLSTLLSGVLRKTNCFEIVEQEGLEQAKAQMAALGKPFTPPKIDLILNATVSNVEVDDNRQNLLFVKVGTKSAKLTMDTKLIDANTGSIIDTASYSSSTTEAATRFELGGFIQVGQGNNQLGLTDIARDASFQAAQDIATRFK